MPRRLREVGACAQFFWLEPYTRLHFGAGQLPRASLQSSLGRPRGWPDACQRFSGVREMR